MTLAMAFVAFFSAAALYVSLRWLISASDQRQREWNRKVYEWDRSKPFAEGDR